MQSVLPSTGDRVAADRTISIGIVGGGIAGLYCAWKLSQCEGSYNVQVFECLDRWGGRIETIDLESFKAECGPMRFELAIQPYFRQFAYEMIGEKSFARFPGYQSARARTRLYALEQREWSQIQSAENGKVPDPSGVNHSVYTDADDLLRYGLFRLLSPDDRDLTLAQVTGKSPQENGEHSRFERLALGYYQKDDYDTIRTTHVLRLKNGSNSETLHKFGFWNALAQVLSPGALAKIREIGSFYHLMPENPSASEWTIFWLRALLPGELGELSTIPGGVATIVDSLRKTLERKNNVVLTSNATVTHLDHGDTIGKVRLTVEKEEAGIIRPFQAQFDHVILALPQWPLRRLSQNFPASVQRYINGVIGFPLLKAFAVMEQPWWGKEKPEPHFGAHIIPTREVHYFTKEGQTEGMVMLYTDRPATAYWQPYIKQPHHEAQVYHKKSAESPQEADAMLSQELAFQLYRSLLEFSRSEGEKKVDTNALVTSTQSTASRPAPNLGTGIFKVAAAILAHAPEWEEYAVQATTDFRKFVENLRQQLSPEIMNWLHLEERAAVPKMECNITAFAIRDWSQPPFGAACHAWAPKIEVTAALQALKAFGLIGREKIENLHICGEAYSDYQGFVEGSLRSAHDVLYHIDPSIPAGRSNLSH